MCGRFTQKDKDLPGIETVDGDASAEDRPRYNGAPSQDFWVIRRHPETGEYRSDRLIWGLIPHWVKDVKGGRKPINAKSETVAEQPSFRAAYAKRRCIVPVNNFFEWRKLKPPRRRRAERPLRGVSAHQRSAWKLHAGLTLATKEQKSNTWAASKLLPRRHAVSVCLAIDACFQQGTDA
jgi:putative SOS response-associated peptidase YedK